MYRCTDVRSLPSSSVSLPRLGSRPRGPKTSLSESAAAALKQKSRKKKKRLKEAGVQQESGRRPAEEDHPDDDGPPAPRPTTNGLQSSGRGAADLDVFNITSSGLVLRAPGL